AMEFSSKDLQDIQRVAGLLNLTVDELLQQRRSHIQTAPGTPPASKSQQQPPQHDPGLRQFPGVPNLQLPESHHQTSQPSLDLDLDAFGPCDPQSSGSGNEPSKLSLRLTATQSQDEEVILLNPQSTWYDCDAAIFDFDPSAAESLTFGDTMTDSGPAEDESYVPVTPMDIDFESVSNHTTREDTLEPAFDETSTDWALVTPSSSSPPAPISSSTSTADRSFHRIAPKAPRSCSKSASETSSHRVKKKRSPYEGRKKIDTHLTRQLHACVRCRMQRNRCIPDPTNPRGPCLTCQQRTVRMSKLPCLRYMVTDSTLHRTGLDYMPFYRTHPMVGPQYGDFHLQRRWTDTPPKYLCLGQVGSLNFKLELREFVPPANSRDVDLKGRPMYAVPWAVADPDAVVEAVHDYIERAITRYLAAYLDDTDPIVWNIFQAAYRASVFPLPNEMLRKTLRLWVACRFIESKWRCWSETGWADSAIRAMNPQDPFYKDIDSLPPYIDYQFASIIMHRILGPLRKDVLRILQSTFNTHSPKDWFASFLTSFILLQNYEMQMLFQRQFAARRRAELFSPGFDWNAPRVRRMARLDQEQSELMSQCRDIVVNKVTMGAETILLGHQGQDWSALAVKANCTPRYFPISHGWPAEVEGDLAWGPSSFTSDDDYTLTLDEADISEIRSGLQHFNGLELYGNEVSPTTFPLPTLGPKLQRVALDIHCGKGFSVVRGLKPDDFSPEDNVLVFLGVSSYIGSMRGRQDEEGNMLMHIRDAKLSRTPQQDRPTRYSSRASTFHTDTFCDILALQTRNNASVGGRNLLASSWTVYNELARTHPRLRELLAQPVWSFDSRGKFLPSNTRPLLYHHDGRIIMNFAREPLLGLSGVNRAPGLAPLSEEQRRALDAVENIARRNQIVLEAQLGDLLFINNHGVLHSREAFEDSQDSPRYLVRTWLKNPELAWKLPRGLVEGNVRIYGENEIGEQWNVVDAPRVMFRLSERLSS
ncbi:Clavaminate synthase-like protein, partial [Parathielavia hyrcaniae]